MGTAVGDDGMAERIAERVWWLDLGRVNAYLVDDGGDLTLVDAGTPFDADDIVAGVSDAGFDVVDVDRVLVTHWDLDHVGGLSKLTPGLQAPVYAGDPDASWLAGESSQPWGNLKGILQHALGVLVSTPDLAVRTVAGGDEVGSFTVHETPGHTPGHCAFVSQRHSTALLGDAVREKNGQLGQLPGLLHYDGGQARRSVEDLAARAPEFDVACVGHGDPLAEGGSDELVRLARE